MPSDHETQLPAFPHLHSIPPFSNPKDPRISAVTEDGLLEADDPHLSQPIMNKHQPLPVSLPIPI